MKNKLVLLIPLFLIIFSSSSFSKWEEMAKNEKGTLYMDFERIRKIEGYVYWWQLTNFSYPQHGGMLSGTIYSQGDCKNFKMRTVSTSLHKKTMGKGYGKIKKFPNTNWYYPPPNSTGEKLLNFACEVAKLKSELK